MFKVYKKIRRIKITPRIKAVFKELDRAVLAELEKSKRITENFVNELKTKLPGFIIRTKRLD